MSEYNCTTFPLTTPPSVPPLTPPSHSPSTATSHFNSSPPAPINTLFGFSQINMDCLVRRCQLYAFDVATPPPSSVISISIPTDSPLPFISPEHASVVRKVSVTATSGVSCLARRRQDQQRKCDNDRGNSGNSICVFPFLL